MSRRALKQLKLLEQSLNNIGFIYNRQSLLFATGVLHKARRQLGSQPSCSGGVLECPSHHRHKGPFFTWGCFGETHFRLLSRTEWSHEWTQCCARHTAPQEYANKNLFRLPHRKCSLQSISSQGHPDQNSLSHNEASFLMTSIQRWEDVKNHEFPVIHLLSNYGLQSLKSPENNVSLILFKETQRDWLSLCSPDWLRTHHIPALPIKC